MPRPAGSFRSFDSHLSPDQIRQRLALRAKRGKLVGYRPSSHGFHLLISGGIYDYELIVSTATVGAQGSRLGFQLKLLRKMPLIAILLIVVTIFPGMYLTDSMLTTYFTWYTIETWWWYMPLTLLMLPVMWKQFRAGQQAALIEANTAIDALEKELSAPAPSIDS